MTGLSQRELIDNISLYYSIINKICSDVTVTLLCFLDTAVVQYDPTNLGNHKTQIKQLTVTAAAKASGFISGSKGVHTLIRYLYFQQRQTHRMM